MGIKTMKEYFETEFNPNDLTTVTWDHAVNSRELLTEALNNTKLMIECDIIFSHNLPVMGHNAGDPYDITFSEFLDEIIKSERRGLVKKGVKLDFKSTIAFNGAMLILEEKMNNLSFPVWINGDIIKGPGGLTNGVILTMMNKEVDKFDNAVMSLGWTTGDYKSEHKDYNDHVARMNFLLDHNYNQTLNRLDITFPVRAMYIVQTDLDKINELIGDKNTLTIWSATQDTEYVDVIKLKLILENMKDRIYLDIPDDLKKKLDDIGDSRGVAHVAGALSIAMSFLMSVF